MLSNAYFLAKFRFDTAENEPAKNLQNFTNFLNFANPNSKPLCQVPDVHGGAERPPAGPPRRSRAARAEPPAPRLPRGEDAPRDVGRLGFKQELIL